MSTGWINGTKVGGQGVALVAKAGRAATLICLDPGQSALLADPFLVVPPKLDRLVAGVVRGCGGDRRCNVFLCAARESGSCLGVRGRTGRRVKPRYRNRVPTLCSASVGAGPARDDHRQIGASPLDNTVLLRTRCVPASLHSWKAGPAVLRSASPARVSSL